MRRFQFLLVSLIGVLLLTHCDVQGPKRTSSWDGEFLPLRPGTTWSLKFVEQDGSDPHTAQIRVAETTVRDAHTYFILRGFIGRDSMLVRPGENGHIYHRLDGRDLLWLDPTPGEDSTYRYADTPVRVTAVDSFDTPSGVYRNCLHFSIDDPDVYDEEHSITIKPGLGFVGQWGAWIGSWRLAEYRTPDAP